MDRMECLCAGVWAAFWNGIETDHLRNVWFHSTRLYSVLAFFLASGQHDCSFHKTAQCPMPNANWTAASSIDTRLAFVFFHQIHQIHQATLAHDYWILKPPNYSVPWCTYNAFTSCLNGVLHNSQLSSCIHAAPI